MRRLTVFRTLEVPLFIDNYGTKNLLEKYETEPVNIASDTPLYHATHNKEATLIVMESGIKASDNKNSLEGVWFGLEEKRSTYGSKAFQTTLAKLKVDSLEQGEIVSYKNEVNVILYASSATDRSFQPLEPTQESLQEQHHYFAYKSVSIFVPKRFLPPREKFKDVFSGPVDVFHGYFCVKEKRGLLSECKELSK